MMVVMMVDGTDAIVAITNVKKTQIYWRQLTLESEIIPTLAFYFQKNGDKQISIKLYHELMKFVGLTLAKLDFWR